MFFRKIVDEKNDKVKFDIIPKSKEDLFSVINGFIRFIDSYRFLSNTSYKLLESIVDNSHESLKKLKKEITGVNIIINIVKVTEKLLGKDENNRTIEYLKKENPDKIIELEEAVNKYMGESDPKIL